MKRVTDEIVPMLHKVWEKGQGWLSRLINSTDHTMTKLTRLLEENKNQFDKYMVNRKELLLDIEMTRDEVELLRKQKGNVGKVHTGKLINLYEKLQVQSDNLLTMQQANFSMEREVEKSANKISALDSEKEKVVQDRNWLRNEYENLQAILMDNTSKVKMLQSELEQLKDEQYQGDKDISYNTIQKEIDNKTKEFNQLLADNERYNKQISDIEIQLLEKAKQIAVLSGNLQKAEKTLKQKEDEVIHLQRGMKEQRQQSDLQQKSYNNLKTEMGQIVAKEKEYEYELEMAYDELSGKSDKLKQLEEDQLQELITEEEKIKKLHNELENERNKLAMEKASNGEPVELSAEASEILKQEYEPRFNTLYKNSHFHDAFFKDYFRLIPSDRLKVEAIIANLNYNFNLHIPKTRPNTIKINSEITINEYPFGKQNVGRIYFNNKTGKINFYRISRTKNGKGKLDQQRVIAWLKDKIK